MTVAVVSRDLLFTSRIVGAGRAAGVEVLRLDSPQRLPSPGALRLLMVDWEQRDGDWPQILRRWLDRQPVPPRVILYGPHTDLAAHATARDAGLGPMWARSRLMSALPTLLTAEADAIKG